MTVYCVKIRFTNTGQEKIVRFESALERALAVISWSAYVNVIKQWEEHGHDAQ